MKPIFLFCWLALCCGLGVQSFGQSKFYIGSDDIFPDHSGKVIAFKTTSSETSDSVYFVDVATGLVTDRAADGSFGLEFKMMKAKVLNRENLIGKGLKAFHTFSMFFDKENFEEYIVRLNDSTLARAWLPKVVNHNEPRVFFKQDNPRKVLLGVRLNRVAMLFDMLDTTSNGVARVLYSRDLSKVDDFEEFERGHLQRAVISPTGNHIFTMPDGTMIDLVKGKKIWDYDYQKTGSSDVVFSEDGTRIAIERKDRSVSVVDVQRGKQLFRIPAPPVFPGELKVEHLMPLADMQTSFVFYFNFKTSHTKILLMKADGSYKEVKL